MSSLFRSCGVINLALVCVYILGLASASSVVNDDETTTHRLHFRVHYMNVTRLCHTKQIVAVNRKFPGPTVYVRTGDTVSVKVTNRVSHNLTIHWHGVKQLFTVWSDGPAYITQCPVQPGNSFTHRFTIGRESGTLFWHAHLSWLRATVYGAFIILPKYGVQYPFAVQPRKEFPIILGEWWNMNVLDVEKYGLADGAGYNMSNASTINGQPGLLYECSQEDAEVFLVHKGENYLLRIINAAMNFNMYFQIAGHKLTIVETDCSFSKPYTTNVILLAPGQTADVLVTADQDVDDYYMATSIYSPARTDFVPYQPVPATAHFRYVGAKLKLADELTFPIFPEANDSGYALNYMRSLKSLNSEMFPSAVPQKLDRRFLFTAGYALAECPEGQVCHGPEGRKVSAAISNISFLSPETSILQAYYESTRGKTKQSVYQMDFPSFPHRKYDYTGYTPPNKYAELGTKVKVLEYKSNVQLVLQSTQTLFFESHPFHLHGYSFYVVGLGPGNFDQGRDSANFNLVDPPLMNTVVIPYGGWVAIRFFTDNPGVWLMHCHFEMHTSWGMEMVWIVKEGKEVHEKLPPPPSDYPPC